MGQKQSVKLERAVRNHASSDDRSVVKPVNVIHGIKKAPTKYFGDRTIENDPSMQQLQRDLLAFDDKVKQGCFSCSKSKRSKSQKYSVEYYYDDEEYYDRNQPPTLQDEDENYLEAVYVNVNPRMDNTKYSWRCRYCGIDNNITTECRQCGELHQKF